MKRIDLVDRSSLLAGLQRELKLDPRETALVTIDMHRGHLDDSPDCPCPAPRARDVVAPIDAFHDRVRALGGRIVHVKSVLREGGDVTIIAWLLMAHFSQQAAVKLAEAGIDAEIVDARTLSPLDWPTLVASARKTGRVVIVEEGSKSGGVGAEISAGLAERLPGLRIERVASPDIPVPFTPVLENAYRPDAARIEAAARRLVQA